jgi:uncharacterized protein (TIGR02646 family)
MRALDRRPLPQTSANYLQSRAARLANDGNTKMASDKAWKAARKTKKVKAAEATLVEMNDGSPRCMYCEHDRARDIDHHCPRDHDPSRTFDWGNWVWSCKTCNSNYKHRQYPPGLLDPTRPGYRFEDHFEFERLTGAFDLKTPDARASATVFGLNEPQLELMRKNSFASLQALIVRYDSLKQRGDTADADRLLHAMHASAFPTILATIGRWHAGPGRILLQHDCVQALDRCPEVLA